jgi:hypothetical protein
MSKRWIAAVALSCSAVASAQAQVWVENGALDCGMWVKMRIERRAQLYEYWVAGTLNGAALSKDIDFWRFKGTVVSREAVFLWIDNYCNANPLNSLIDAILQLFMQRTGSKI